MAAPPATVLSADRGWPILSLGSKAVFRAGLGPAVDLRVDGHWILAEAPQDPRRVNGDHGFDLVYSSPAGTITDRFTAFPRFPNCFARTLLFTNGAGRRVDLDGLVFDVGLAAPPGTRLWPTHYSGGPGPARWAPPEARSWQCQSFGMAEIAPHGPTACAAFTSDEDFYSTRADQDGIITHSVDAAWRLEPGQEARVGAEYLWVIPGGLDEARRSAQDWYDAVGLTVADGGPPWLGDIVLYQASAGGSVDSRFSDTGGFGPFSRQVDYLSDMGFNAIWLMSVLKHKDPRTPRESWNLYGTLDYHQVDPAYGGDSGLTQLVGDLRGRGFHIFSEIVPSGGFAPLCIQHQDWWTYNRDGSRRRGFGQGLDYSSPGWQATIRDSIAWMARTWGFDGWRVDVADGYGVDWAPWRCPHVSLSTMGGSLGMLRAIREGHLQSGRSPVIIPESGQNRPEQARWGQLGYGSPLTSLLSEIHPASMNPAELGRALTDFFEHERGSLPRGMFAIRTLNNHDTVVDHGRADRRFGIGLQRVLTGVCAVVPGVPMVYQEQDVGSYNYYRGLFWGRRRAPEMCRGDADYLGIKTDPRLFSVLRSLSVGGRMQYAVGLVNLSPQSVEGPVLVPPGVLPPGEFRITDTVSGKSVIQRADDGRDLRWSLGPYATAMLRIGAKADGPLPPERYHSPSQAASTPAPPGARGAGSFRWWVEKGDVLQVRAPGMSARFDPAAHPVSYDPLPGGRVAVKLGGTGSSDPSLQVLGVDRWMVSASTGDYEDRLIRRHYPWPPALYEWKPTTVWGFEPYNLYHGVLPAGRQWQSAVAPLHPRDPRVVFASAGAGGLLLNGILTNAQNTILTDRSEEADPDPYGLSLQFLAADKALNPLWSPAYASGGWREVPGSLMPPPTSDLHVAFEVGPMLTPSDLQPEEAPSATYHEWKLEVGPGENHPMGNRIWLVEPNSVTWKGLILRTAGTWDLWIQLRHSEAGPAGRDLCPYYQVEVDGRPVELEFVRLNAWSTGNGYLGWARVPHLSLADGLHTVRLTTTHTWCAFLPELIISRDPAFRP